MLLYDANGLCERTGGVDFVVDDEGVSPFDGADDAHRFRDAVIAMPTLFNDGKRGTETVSQLTSFFGKTFIGGDNCKIVQFFLHEVTCQDDLSGEFVDRDIEKAL